MNTAIKPTLIVFRSAPYGSSRAREATDIALAFAAFDINPTIIFTGDGVYQLLPSQHSDAIEAKNQQKLLSAFALYDINPLYVDQAALLERKLSPESISLPVTLLATEAIHTLLKQHSVILSF